MKKAIEKDTVKILLVDDQEDELGRILDLPFGKKHQSEIKYVKSPVGLSNLIPQFPNLRLIILDILWPSQELGADAMVDLSFNAPEIPVVIYSILDREEDLTRLIPEMMRLGAYDWISKEEPSYLRSFRLERAFMKGRDVNRTHPRRAILPPDQQHRPGVHVTSMFVDMCGFTALTNELGGTQMVVVLVDFYSLVCESIMKHGGYIDKYIGDAVMAVYGASGKGNGEKSDQHVRDCIQSAREIIAGNPSFRINRVENLLNEANIRLTPEQKENMGKFRIGIESGKIEIVRFEKGNQSEITFIGTPVNVASRILGEASPNEIWIGENARTSAKSGDIIGEREVEYKNLPGTFHMYHIRV